MVLCARVLITLEVLGFFFFGSELQALELSLEYIGYIYFIVLSIQHFNQNINVNISFYLLIATFLTNKQSFIKKQKKIHSLNV